MDSKQLQTLFSIIRECPYFNEKNPPCKRIKKFKPVINNFSPEQKYMIISSDPSGDTDKTLAESVPHSDFAIRFLSLIFSGNDDKKNASLTKNNYAQLFRIFNKYFYWTHVAKCYCKGNPNLSCAKEYLLREVELFKPRLLIIISNKAADFLMGNKPLTERVCKNLNYQGIPTFCSLHPSRDWNLNKRPKYKFDETWKIIRSKLRFSSEDKAVIESIFSQQIFP